MKRATSEEVSCPADELRRQLCSDHFVEEADVPDVVEGLAYIEQKAAYLFSTTEILLDLLRQVEEVVCGAPPRAEAGLAGDEEAIVL